MAWRECTNCGMKQAPYEPRKRKGDHLLCKACVTLPVDSLKATGVRKTADEEGTPGADLSSDFAPALDLRDIYQTPVSTNTLGHPINHIGLPTSAPYGDEMWPERNDLGTDTHALLGALPNQVWINRAKKRRAMGFPSVHGYRGLNKGFGARLAAKTAHADPDGNQDLFGTHSHHPYVMPLVPPPSGTLGPLATHMMEKHLDSDGVSAEAMSDAAGDHYKMHQLHLDAHAHGDKEHGHPAGKQGHFHQHIHSGSSVKDDPNMADWEKALLGHVGDYDVDEDGENDDATPKYEHPKKIKDHLLSGHGVPEDQISGSDLFNHGFHDDLHEGGVEDHSHHPPAPIKGYVEKPHENSSAAHKAHLVAAHGMSPYDVSYDDLAMLKSKHDDQHKEQYEGDPHGGIPDHQHTDDTAPKKWATAHASDPQAHLHDEHGISQPDQGPDAAHEKHVFVHAQKNDHNQPHYHEADDPTEMTPAPPTAPGGAKYQALVEHMKEGNSHNGGYYEGWENGESYDSIMNHHKYLHEGSYGTQPHTHEDMNDPTGAGSYDELKAAETGEGADEDAAPKVKKPSTLPQYEVNHRGQIPEPEMGSWPTPEVDHPTNKSEVIQHLQDHHPEVNAEDYENSEFKNEGFLKGWHSHLHSGKESHLSPSDLHVHGNDDSKPKFTQDDNLFSHMVTHHGMSEDEAKSHRYVDLKSSHAHTHESGDDEEIGHQHDYPGAPPSEPSSWVVNPQHAGQNWEHEWYHGTSNDYAGAPVNATQNQYDRGNFGNHGTSIYDCHVGPHFTSLHEFAKDFGSGRIVSVKVKGKKPKYYDNLNHMAHDAYDRLHALGEIKDGGHHLGKHYQDPKYSGAPINSDSNTYGGCCSQALLKYAMGQHRDDGKYGMRRFRDSLRADGYDHIIVRNHADSYKGHENLIPLSPKQLHVVSERCPRSHGDERDHDGSNFRAPAGWTQGTMPNEKEKLRPPAYLVDKDPQIGNPYDLPKTAPEHPDDQGDPHNHEKGLNPGSTHSTPSGDDDEDDEDSDNSDYCNTCDEYTSHSSYDSHCGECNQYTGDESCDCEYCPACGYDTSHGSSPGDYHEYCEHCDNEGESGGYGDHDSDNHEDEYGEHPDKFKDSDWCPHCDTHDKQNRDEDHCQNCGETLPDWEQVSGQKPAAGDYPVKGGGQNQWDHKTHAWGHLAHDHGLDLSEDTTDPETLKLLHHKAHTDSLKYGKTDPETGQWTTEPHKPGHTHPEFPVSSDWDKMSKDQKAAHLAEGHNGLSALNSLSGFTEEQLNHKHTQGHNGHYEKNHSHGEEDPAAPMEHAPENVLTHMKTLHGLNQNATLTPELAHALHEEQHANGKPMSEWHHEHTADGVNLTGKYDKVPGHADAHISTIEHMHDHHAGAGQTVPGIGYTPDSVQASHLQMHNKDGGGLSPHDHPVTGINGGTPTDTNPHTDPYGHLMENHGWTQDQVQQHKAANTWQTDETQAGKDVHLYEHQHGGTGQGDIYNPHTHSAPPENGIPAIPEAYKPKDSGFSQYEQHKQHMEETHGLVAPEGQNSKWYANLHAHLHDHDHDAAHELGLEHDHAHHEHDTSGSALNSNQPFYGKGDGYGLKDHLIGAHAQWAKANGVAQMDPYGEAIKNLHAAHQEAHKHAEENNQDWVHKHAPDPDAPLLPEHGHLSDDLVKHMVSHHAASPDGLKDHEHNDSLIAAHIAEHNGHDESGTLPYDYNSSNAHKHTVKSLETQHGSNVVDGKPTEKMVKNVEQGNVNALAGHLNTYHPHPEGHYYSASDHPDKLLADHAAGHAEGGPMKEPHNHNAPGLESAVGTEPVEDAVEHLSSHHGIDTEGLADKGHAYVQLLHTHHHYDTSGDQSDFPVKHDHDDQGTGLPTYPAAQHMPAVHEAHDLAHHMEEHHGATGVHGYDQDTLLDAHAAAHVEMKDLAGTPAPQHQHGLMYPAGHEKGKPFPSTSPLHEHLKAEHGMSQNNVNNMTPAQLADSHESQHMQSGHNHKHDGAEMNALADHQGLIGLPPKAVPPLTSTYDLDSHLSLHHGLDYNAQNTSKLVGQAGMDFHEAEHATGIHDHVHQAKHTGYGLPPYPQNPVGPVTNLHEHLATEHGMHVPAEHAGAMHDTLHKGHATDHDHQPLEHLMPSATPVHGMNANTMSDHLVEHHGFNPDVAKGLDMPSAVKAHASSHEPDALPFHTHPTPDNPNHKTPIQQMDPDTHQTVLANHLSNQHGVDPKNNNGEWHTSEALAAIHDQHHEAHGDEGFMHHHPVPVDVDHFDPINGDMDAAKQHLIDHHQGTESSVAGMTANGLKQDHDHYHSSSYYAEHQMTHNHLPPVPKAHGDMSKIELVQHLNEHHNGPSLTGGTGNTHEWYEQVHAHGHGEGPPAPLLIDGGAQFSPKKAHDHPDYSVAHPEPEGPAAPEQTGPHDFDHHADMSIQELSDHMNEHHNASYSANSSHEFYAQQHMDAHNSVNGGSGWHMHAPDDGHTHSPIPNADKVKPPKSLAEEHPGLYPPDPGKHVMSHESKNGIIMPPVQNATMKHHLANHHYWEPDSGMSQEAMHDKHDELHHSPIDNDDKHGHLLSPQPATKSNWEGVHDGNVDEHLKKDHGATIGGGWEEQIGAHNALHAQQHQHLDHAHDPKVTAAPPALADEPHFHPSTQQHHLTTHHGIDAGAVDSLSHYEMHTMHKEEHGEPLATPHVHEAPPQVPHVEAGPALAQHMVDAHKVSEGHEQLADPKFHAELHADPSDQHDSSHTHLPEATTGGGLPIEKTMLHPNALNLDMHLEKHGIESHQVPFANDAQHEMHAQLHKNEAFGHGPIHDHHNWTGEGNGITHTSALVDFFEREWV